MLRFLADENFNNVVLRGLRRKAASFDVVRVQDVGLMNADDTAVLEWAAAAGRVILTHDVTTMAFYAFKLIDQGRPMAGVIEVALHMPIGAAIDEILYVSECSFENEWTGKVLYLPLRKSAPASQQPKISSAPESPTGSGLRGRGTPGRR